MIELVVVGVIVAVIVVSVLLGRSQATVDAGQQIRDAEAHAAAERANAEAEREARERAERAERIEEEIADAAPPSLEPRARMDAVDRWARMRSAQERARRAKAAGTVPGADDTPAVPGKAPTGAGRKPDR